jgi:hypothetical protein
LLALLGVALADAAGLDQHADDALDINLDLENRAAIALTLTPSLLARRWLRRRFEALRKLLKRSPARARWNARCADCKKSEACIRNREHQLVLTQSGGAASSQRLFNKLLSWVRSDRELTCP